MKLRRMWISPEFLADILINPGITMIDAPRDLRIADCIWRPMERRIELLVSSPDFNDPADVQEPPPLWQPMFRREVNQ